MQVHNQNSIRLVHWNIRELDSHKLSAANNPQVDAAARVLQKLNPDILSINELHFDEERARILGLDNLQDFTSRFAQGKALHQQTFAPANTGLRAGRDLDGAYLKALPDRGDPRLALLDRSNFGLFPGQYATGLATKFPIKDRLIIQKLLWREWQANARLADYTWGKVGPDSIELFDKSLSVSWLDCMGTSVAIICLHAVPAFHFGQVKSPNIARNAAQLSFLEWFLLGEPAPSRSAEQSLRLAGIEPLRADQKFIAVGDFNCPLFARRYPGRKVLQRLLNHSRIQARQARIPSSQLQGLQMLKPEHSFFSSGWDWTMLPSQLDYIMVSKEIEILEMRTIFSPPEQKIHCLLEKNTDAMTLISKYQEPGRTFAIKHATTYGQLKQDAIVSVASDFAELRAASDHLPLLLDFQLK